MKYYLVRFRRVSPFPHHFQSQEISEIFKATAWNYNPDVGTAGQKILYKEIPSPIDGECGRLKVFLYAGRTQLLMQSEPFKPRWVYTENNAGKWFLSYSLGQVYELFAPVQPEGEEKFFLKATDSMWVFLLRLQTS